jgi:hypothetical protein
MNEGIRSGSPNLDSTPSRSNRSVGIFVLAVMGLVALAGLGFALKTWGLRESRHPKSPVELQPARPHIPGDLPALGYLPADCQIMTGVYLAEMRKEPAGVKLLEPPLPGLLGLAINAVEKRTGFKIDDIEHAVFGITLDGIVPQLTAVVRTNRKYTLQEVANAVHGKPLRHHNLPLFRIKLDPVGGGYLWCADEFTLVMVLRPDAAKIEDMDKIPAKPRKASEGLSEPLQDLLENRLRFGVIWLAGNIPDPQPIQTLAGLTRLPRSDIALLTKIKSFALGISLQDDVTLSGSLESRDDAAVAPLETYLTKLDFPAAKSRKVIGPPPKAHGPEAHWVNLQIRTDAAGMRKALQAFDGLVPRMFSKK